MVGGNSPRGRNRGGPLGPLLAAAILLAAFICAAVATGDETSAPTISGDPRVGETLTASPASVYKWQRCDPEVHACGTGQGNHAIGWEDIEGGQGQGLRTYIPVEADIGRLIRVLAKDNGTQYVPSAPVGPVAPAESNEPPPEEPPPEEPPPEEPPPDPVFNRTGNLDPVAGSVWVRLPGSKAAERIEDVTQIPLGTEIDVGAGRVELVTQRQPGGRLQSIELWAGAFRLGQRKRGRVTMLRLIGSFGGPAETVSMARKRRGKLWGKGKCRCRTRGKRSSGTARGTWWLTAERANGTLTKVLEGKVLVRDLVRKRKVTVKAGQQYLAGRR